jgi:hypothetical protein
MRNIFTHIFISSVSSLLYQTVYGILLPIWEVPGSNLAQETG